MKIVITTGRSREAPGSPTDKLHSIARSHPFTQQVDIVLPSHSTLEESLLELKAAYWRCECTLSDFLEFAKTHDNATGSNGKVVAYGTANPTEDDVWCLDPRGFLTLAVCKETYETLGLVGKSFPWKEHKTTHVVHISLRDPRLVKDESKVWLSYGTKEADAIRRWDAARGPWKIWCYLDSELDVSIPGSARYELVRSVRIQESVHIPDIQRDSVVLPGNCEGDRVDEWEDYISSLFEWVGMASLGSPRISVSDRCEPYIAVYTHPTPSRIGNITTIRWKGFIPSVFVQGIADTISSPNLQAPPSFVAVTAQCVGASPVTYMPSDTTRPPILRVPEPDAEDAWSLVYVKEEAGGWWTLAESVGGRDRRWG
ncbi:ribonuclease P 40kDa subunit-domain-containing protein [Trametes gibbosa]|nr:ribonuclease P 40kDa subunit-domain-containing protein [Trametes gibbosa]